ncbi:MAG: TonB-dependent receptor [Gemmatimonadetes bacterium]|nr:TonB-dependent receptor [Gemmatimonadota bacterium]MYD14048.1 TonB-dependent receptor [Gemmatimonadota bacterium]
MTGWRGLALGSAMTLLAAVPFAQAQERAGQAPPEFEVTGTVVDTAGMGLANAMVVALSREDSVLVKYSMTNRDGHFSIPRLPGGEYILQVTQLGYQAVRRDFDATNADFDAGRVVMEVMAVEVEDLVVSIEHVPFINRRDTLSYNPAAFQTPPNATVEDLLRRLPGIEVAADGSIKAQGEDVQNVLVDGREFFGRDPTIATRNLPAAAIRQVDVYDKQSDMAEFTGIPDGEDERTVDLRLKEEAKVGYFGRASGGFGSDIDNQARLGGSAANDARYDGALNLNRFSPTGQYAVILNANNVGNAGFSSAGIGEMVIGDLMMFGGGVDMLSGMLGGGGGGFSESMSGGVNASHEFGDNNWLRSSYFYNELDNVRNSTVQQQALFGSDVASVLDQSSRSESNSGGHRLNLNGQLALSPGHQLRVRVNANLRSSLTSQFTTQETHNAAGGMLNSAVTDYFTDGDDLGGDAQVTWRKRLNESGRSVVAEYRSAISDYEYGGDLTSQVTGLRPGSVGAAGPDETRQEQNRLGRTWSNSARLSLTQPLGEGHSLEVFGQRNSTSEDRDNPVYDIVDDARVFNQVRSTGFERAYTYYLAGARFSRIGDGYWISTGLRVQRSSLDGVISDRDRRIENGYTHLLANLDLKTEVKEGHNLSVGYSTSSREPSLTQLQPFVNNTDPLNIYTGNPNLQPEYTHSMKADYRFFDQFSFVNFFTFGGFSYTDNTIAQSRFYDDRGVQTRSPINTDGSWSASVGANFGTPIRRLGVDMDVEYRVTYSEGTELVNLVANDNRSTTNTVQLSLNNRVRDRFDVRAGASFSFNDARYSLNQELNRSYVNSRYFANGTLYAPGAWTIRSTFSYQVFDRDLYGSSQSRFGQPENIARWDASVMRRLLDNRVEIELRANDLLNQNQGVTISNRPNFIQESRTESLGQFFMLRASYRLGGRGFIGGLIG